MTVDIGERGYPTRIAQQKITGTDVIITIGRNPDVKISVRATAANSNAQVVAQFSGWIESAL